MMAAHELIGDDIFSDDAIRDALREKAKDYGTGGALLSVNDVMDVIEANPLAVFAIYGGKFGHRNIGNRHGPDYEVWSFLYPLGGKS